MNCGPRFLDYKELCKKILKIFTIRGKGIDAIMTNETYVKITDDLHKKRMDIFHKKSHDYAGQDVLSNFKRLATAAKALEIDVQSAWGYALFMALLKIDRINNLVKNGKTPANESIDDSFLDAHNYLDLSRAILHELQSMMENLEMGVTSKELTEIMDKSIEPKNY